MPQTSRDCSEAAVIHNMLFAGRSHNRAGSVAVLGIAPASVGAGNHQRGNSEIRV
jgi:hypothetical protein